MSFSNSAEIEVVVRNSTNAVSPVGFAPHYHSETAPQRSAVAIRFMFRDCKLDFTQKLGKVKRQGKLA